MWQAENFLRFPRRIQLFNWWGEYYHNPLVMENPMALKFSKPIRMLGSFTRNFSRKALSFEFTFCLAVQHYDWKLQNNKFWLLMDFVFLWRCVSLTVKLILLSYKFVVKWWSHHFDHMTNIKIFVKVWRCFDILTYFSHI